MTSDYLGLTEDEWKEVRYHSDTYPHHGEACQCMDMWVLRVRLWFEREYGGASEFPRFLAVLQRAVAEWGARG